MNDKKICFITCVNDDRQYEECLLYINNLNIPKGYEIDVISIKEAESITSAYNAAIQDTDAKYKVYLHQDTYIINKDFLYDILGVFNSNDKVGMIGVAGAKTIPPSGIWWESIHKYGKVYDSRAGKIELLSFNEVTNAYEEVKAIDGLIMITQYDIHWKEDIFDGWHFHDVSQSMEFIKSGYIIVIPKQREAWCIHDCEGFNPKDRYDDYRKKFLDEYSKEIFRDDNNIVNLNKNTSEKFYKFGRNSRIQGEAEIFTAEGISIGNNVSIQKDVRLMLPYNNFNGEPRIIIEDGCDIGKRLTVSATNKIVIEKNVIIAANVHITDHNHEYKEVGIPIMYQGVTSFTNEVIIGQGSWIANNCVIVGNVHIGRGCTIAANSVVTKDIPDYCVVAGSPARVKKCFDRVSGKWIKVKDENHLMEVIEERQTFKPLLTIGIFTYNRSNYLDKCLYAIFNQIGNDSLFEVLVCDNNSTDNTNIVVDKYKSKYNNLVYYKNENNIGAMKNVHKVLEKASGEFVIAHGDDDYLAYLTIYKLVDMIYKNRNCSLMYMLPSNDNFTIYNGEGINNYVEQVSFVTTFISGMVVKKDEFDKIVDKEKFIYTDINQVYIQLELLRNNPNFAILKGNTLSRGSGEHKPSGYNFGEVFIKNYLDILTHFKEFGLKEDVVKNEKYKLLTSMIIPWCRKIINENIDLDISNIMSLVYDYYNSETYFNEANRELQMILKK
ncbi:glycosyltransferase [Clostridium sp. A1-XYC3]|uniref:Glycosyltransferase n=1 Tax=Clostridium tanneri TaxID=3037988 RepID=A0ABU4JNK7_9CLOT|nr:glycosyltransferase [Clostridium sp. A1-XYC3]MDW8799692.1 glycosyltransferase [Clostridium sp. A1-XYC3]